MNLNFKRWMVARGGRGFGFLTYWLTHLLTYGSLAVWSLLTSTATGAVPGTNYPVVVFDALLHAGVPAVEAKVIVEPLQDRVTNGAGQVFLPRQINMSTDTNGAVETNLYVPCSYRVRFVTQSPKSELVYTNVFGAAVTGRVASANYIFPPTNSAPGSLVAYSQVQSDGRYPQVAGTNLLAVTNVVAGQTVITWHGTGSGGGVGEVTTAQLNTVSNLLAATKGANTNGQLYGHHSLRGTNATAPQLEFTSGGADIGVLRWAFGGNTWEMAGQAGDWTFAGPAGYVLAAYGDRVEIGDNGLDRVEVMAPLVAPSLALDDVADVGPSINSKLGHTGSFWTNGNVVGPLAFNEAAIGLYQPEPGRLEFQYSLDEGSPQLVIDGNTRRVEIGPLYDLQVGKGAAGMVAGFNGETNLVGGTVALTNVAPATVLFAVSNTAAGGSNLASAHGPQIAGNSNNLVSASNVLDGKITSVSNVVDGKITSASNVLDAKITSVSNVLDAKITSASNVVASAVTATTNGLQGSKAENTNAVIRGTVAQVPLTVIPLAGTASNVFQVLDTNGVAVLFRVASNGTVSLPTSSQDVLRMGSGAYPKVTITSGALIFTTSPGTADYMALYAGSSGGARVLRGGGFSWDTGTSSIADAYDTLIYRVSAGTVGTTNLYVASYILQGFSIIAPAAPAAQGALYWNDGTNTCVVYRNSAGTLTTNKLSKVAWP